MNTVRPSVPHTPPTLADLSRLIDTALSPRERTRYLTLLMGALSVTVAVASVWLTESSLPLRTHLALGAIVVVGASWTIYATWVLVRRQTLLPTHRVVAARMGVGFSALFSMSSVAVAWWTPFGRQAVPAALVGTAWCVTAVVVLWRAQRRVAALRARRGALEQAVGTALTPDRRT